MISARARSFVAPVAAGAGGLLLAALVYMTVGSGARPDVPWRGAVPLALTEKPAFAWSLWPAGRLSADTLEAADWLLAFTAPDCHPCERCYPWLRHAAQSMHVALVVLADSTAGARAGAAAICARWPCDWVVAVATHGQVQSLFRLRGLPTVLATRGGRYFEVPPSEWATYFDRAQVAAEGGR